MMSRFGISFKSPSYGGAFFLCIVFHSLCSFAAWTNVYETEVKSEVEAIGVVSVIQPNYISIIYNNATEGIDQEIGFVKHDEIQMKYRAQWDEIRAGDEVIFRFTEIRSTREGRVETGEFRQESYVKDRRLNQLEFEKPVNKPLVSG